MIRTEISSDLVLSTRGWGEGGTVKGKDVSEIDKAFPECVNFSEEMKAGDNEENPHH